MSKSWDTALWLLKCCCIPANSDALMGMTGLTADEQAQIRH
ncbi:hypothetical protein [Pantoea sp. AS142]